MRAALCVALCLVLVATAYAEDLVLGECGDDDVLVLDRNIRRPAIPGIPMYTKLIARSRLRTTISCISVKSTDGTEPDFRLIKGGVGHRYVLILVRGKPGQGLSIQFTVRAHPRVPPTGKPTTTPSLPTIPTGIPTEGPTSPTPTSTSRPPTSTEPGTSTPLPTIPTGIPTATSTDVDTTTGAPITEPTVTSTTEAQPTAEPTNIPTVPPRSGDVDVEDDVSDLSESLDSLGDEQF